MIDCPNCDSNVSFPHRDSSMFDGERHVRSRMRNIGAINDEWYASGTSSREIIRHLRHLS